MILKACASSFQFGAFHPSLEGRISSEAATPGHQFTGVNRTSPGDYPRGITGNAKLNRQSFRMFAL
jgi:hypothetical protein